MKAKLFWLVCAGVCLTALVGFVSSRQRVHAGAGALVETTLNGTVAEPVDVRYDVFDVEVLVNGRPVELYRARGRYYVEALKGAEYELRVRNPLGVRVAVALSVDGMNTIDARRTAAWNAAKWVIEPYQTITVRGWQMSSERARRFYFTSERDSYGAKLGQTSNLGVISAVFFRERRPVTVVRPPRTYGDDGMRSEDNREQRSQSAPQSSAGASPSAKSRRGDVYPAPDDEAAATGIGRNVRNDVRWVNLDLDSRPAAEVDIRYEYREGLVRLGIMPRPYPYPYPDPTQRRERSTGFEDRRYSPEP